MPQKDWDIVIVGAGVGGCAAALAATDLGCSVLLVEPTDWIGGQLTSQGAPPDEHRWIESHGRTRSYARFRELVRQHYRDHFPLRPDVRANPLLNPGGGWVSALCCEPRVAQAVLEDMLAPAQNAGLLKIRRNCAIIAAETASDRVTSVTMSDTKSSGRQTVTAAYFVDGTEAGDLLPLAEVEYRIGTEGRRRFGELHAPEDDLPENVQALTWCMAVACDPAPGANHTIEQPTGYDFWRSYRPNLAPPWPGTLLSEWYTNPFTMQPRRLPIISAHGAEPDLFSYRRIVSRSTLEYSKSRRDVTLVNWPQNDYLNGNILDKPAETVNSALNEAKELTLSLLYWLQTEAPRSDGGVGYPELMPDSDTFGTSNGLAIAPYIRESRRIDSILTVTEEHVGAEMLRVAGREKAVAFTDSVGVGHYRIDLHPTTGGDNYIDIEAHSFQIPLGALIPIRIKNLLPACKNIGTTHITNGCFRLHPVEWNIGESVGYLAAWCAQRDLSPHAVRDSATLLTEFQELIRNRGIETEWPIDHPG